MWVAYLSVLRGAPDLSRGPEEGLGATDSPPDVGHLLSHVACCLVCSGKPHSLSSTSSKDAWDQALQTWDQLSPRTPPGISPGREQGEGASSPGQIPPYFIDAPPWGSL